MSTKKIDLGNVLDMVDKSTLFADKVEHLFSKMTGTGDNDLNVCLALDVIEHYKNGIRNLWEKIRTAPEADQDYGQVFWDYVAKEKGLNTQDKMTDKQNSIFIDRFLIPFAQGHIFTEEETGDLKKQMEI